MSTFKSFALIGATGNIGKYILNAFRAIDIHPLVVTRKTSNSAVPSGLTVAKVDLDNVDEVSQTLQQHGIEVVISTVTAFALESQQRLADAAKRAGVKLFVPSEFALPAEDTSGLSGNFAWVFEQKKKFVDYLESIGLPWVRFHTGLFTSFVPWLGAVGENGKFNVEKGKGHYEITVTDDEDVAGFLVHVLTTLPPKDLENRPFRISGEDVSLETLGKRINKEVEFVDTIPGSGAQFRTTLLALVYTGQGVTSWDSATKAKKRGPQATDNHIWAGHEWKKL
ncbi:hypothetical protein VNI00_005260 [Paramarasmius palmivorus]|uniref:NmrA-like domain-containing protein n=1 Tax=Paramarasmius palmivorus TaxID=297713 RepID=A0AAW0DBJ4_9AGAR